MDHFPSIIELFPAVHVGAGCDDSSICANSGGCVGLKCILKHECALSCSVVRSGGNSAVDEGWDVGHVSHRFHCGFGSDFIFIEFVQLYDYPVLRHTCTAGMVCRPG